MDEEKNPTIEIQRTPENVPTISTTNETVVPVEAVVTQKPEENEISRVGFAEEEKAMLNENSTKVNEQGMIIVEETATRINNPSNEEANNLLKNLIK